MKFYLLSALIIIAFFAACKKGDSPVTPVKITAPQADSISQANSISQASPANPPVAKYVGTMIANARYGGTCDAPYPENDTDLSFVYCVTNIENESLTFWAQNPLFFYGFDSAISISGTFPMNAQNCYPYNPPYAPVFKIVMDSLYVIGHYSANVNITYNIGYDGQVVMSFAGKLQPDTATVQAKRRKA